MKKQYFIILSFLLISGITGFITFKPIFQSNQIIITYGIHPFNICDTQPELWKFIKISFIFTYIFSNIVISRFIFYYLNLYFIKNTTHKICSNNFQEIKYPNLLIGQDKKNNKKVYIPESGLYQNFLITGTIGSGKTSSAMYPFTEQLMKYNSIFTEDKIGMLILDVKGNYSSQVKKYAQKYNLLDDLIVIELNSNIRFNPLHKPNLRPQVLANRLRIILELFSENNQESYWLDKAEQILTECIKLCRLYNNGYVNFKEIHKLVTIQDYYLEKIEVLKDKFKQNNFSTQDIYNLNSSLEFFQKEFFSLDQRTLSILKSEITRITNVFVSDYDISKTFSPNENELNFTGFSEVVQKGKIVVLNMNISEYRNLSKIIAAYLKLDFQTEILSSLHNNIRRKTAFICDEYAEYVTKSDAEFFSLSREAKCINIVSTQSYSSIKNTLHDETSTKVIIQNLINKLWFRTDDIFTIEEAQKQIGKEEKTKISKSVSESAKSTNYNYITNSLNSHDSNISESYNTYSQNDFIFDTNHFSQSLETFHCLAFLSDGNKILKPCILKTFPYFLNDSVKSFMEKYGR
ncbi:MAG: type IV secretion system DNA-binding domain-containing protein [Clostridia bacterium]|nr:type IV secretion system DNA-binding domain-containing protein [Clostridia bacterium]